MKLESNSLKGVNEPRETTAPCLHYHPPPSVSDWSVFRLVDLRATGKDESKTLYKEVIISVRGLALAGLAGLKLEAEVSFGTDEVKAV